MQYLSSPVCLISLSISQGLSMYLQKAGFSPFSWVNNIPLGIQTTSVLSTHSLMNI